MTIIIASFSCLFVVLNVLLPITTLNGALHQVLLCWGVKYNAHARGIAVAQFPIAVWFATCQFSTSLDRKTLIHSVVHMKIWLMTARRFPLYTEWVDSCDLCVCVCVCERERERERERIAEQYQVVTPALLSFKHEYCLDIWKRQQMELLLSCLDP